MRTSLELSTFLLVWILAFPAGSSGQDSPPEPEKPEDSWVYLDNGTLRLGVDRARGAGIGYLARSSSRRNLLNHRDEGRFIQQSYYGDPDGSKWNTKPWVYNPVQGGSWKGQRSRLLEFKVEPKRHRLFARIEPRSWSSGAPCPEAPMEQRIRLEGPVARVACRFKYRGSDQKGPRGQEMPAVFVDAALETLVTSEGGKLRRRVPGWPNEYGKTGESWFAYVDGGDHGVGIFTPGTVDYTCYRAIVDDTTGPASPSCSYVAPVRRFTLKRGLVLEYEYFLTIGSLEEIRERFEKIREELEREKARTEEKPGEEGAEQETGSSES